MAQGTPGRVRRLNATRRPDWLHERRLEALGATRIAGVDEVGRGCLAGPVVACAVLLPRSCDLPLADSKQLRPSQREAVHALLTQMPGVVWATGMATAAEIDRMNILRASQEAMRRAILALDPQPDAALVDGPAFAPFPVAMHAVVGGDAVSVSIAAASIIAKVERDAMMRALDIEYPGYGFATHKGYGTTAHREALQQLGASPHHRRSFAPVAAFFPAPGPDQLA